MKHQHNQRVHLTHPKFLTTTWFFTILTLLWATLAWAIDIPPAWRDALQETGTARVIVVLNIPVQPEGTLNEADAIVAQRAQIAQAQQLVLDSLQPQGSAETRFETIPALVMVADSQTLTQLEDSPLVASLQLDAADEAMAGQTIANQLKELERVYESSHSYAEVTTVTVSPASAHEGDVRELMVANLQSVGITVARGEESASGRQVRAANPGMPVASCGGITAGLVACYPFDGDAKDYSGNGHDGTNNGATLTTDRSGKANSAYLFNGTSNFIEVKDTTALRLANTDFSLSLWIYETARNSSYADALLVKRGQGSRDGWGYSIRGYAGTAGQVGYGVSGGGDPAAYSVTLLPLNSWHHVLMTYNKTLQQVRIYRDGVLDSQTNGIPSPNPNTVSNLFIGKDSANAYNGYYFHGMMDDVRIYNRALSDTEIQQLAGIQPPKCDGITTGLVLCLLGGENAWDGSGNGNHGLIQGVVPTQDRSGNPNGAYKFDSGAYIMVPNSPSINISGNLTVSAWIRSSGTPQHSGLFHKEPLVSSGNRVTGYQVSVNKGAGEWAIGIYDSWPSSGGASFSPTKVVDGNWHHLVAVYDWQTITIYTDGIKSNSVPYTKGMLPNDRPLYIGVDPDLWGGRDFRGDIDDVRIYNRALSDTEVKQLAGIQPPKCDGITTGLVLCLPLGENAWDGSGNGNHGLIQGVVVPTQDRSGKPNGAYKFDGSAYIQVPNSPSINIAGNLSFSVWVRSSGTPQHTGLFHKETLANSGNRVTGWQAAVNSYGANNLRMNIWDSWPSAGGTTPSLTKVIDGNWHHLVGVYDGQTVTVYIDGIKDNTVPYTKGMLPNDRPLYIGVDPDVWGSAYWGPRDFHGDMDDVRIYNRALSEAEVKQLAGIVEPAKVTLTVTKTGTGQVTSSDATLNCGTTCKADYAQNSTVTLTATPTTGNTFTQWSGACSGTTATTTVTLDQAKTCTATFAKVIPKYTLTVSKTGTGTGSITGTGITCGTDCTEDYTAKTLVTLTATPYTGSKLVSWGGSCSGTATTATVTMNQAKSCTANFVPANVTTFTLTVAKAGKGQGTIRAQVTSPIKQTVSQPICNATCLTQSYDYPLTNEVSLTAAPATGFVFKSWSCNGSYRQTGTPTLIKVTMDAAKTCTATFE